MDDALVLVNKLRQDGEKLQSFLLGLSESERSAQVYTEGAHWTVRSVLAHLTSAERAFVHLFREIQRGGAGVGEGFEIDSFNAREQRRNDQMTWEELFSLFKGTRASMIEWVATLTPDDLQKVGRHPFLGVTSLREMIKMIYIHDQTHLRDIRRALGST